MLQFSEMKAIDTGVLKRTWIFWWESLPIKKENYLCGSWSEVIMEVNRNRIIKQLAKVFKGWNEIKIHS